MGTISAWQVRRAVAAAEKPAAAAPAEPSGQKRKTATKQPSVDITLPHGSLLIMWCVAAALAVINLLYILSQRSCGCCCH